MPATAAATEFSSSISARNDSICRPSSWDGRVRTGCLEAIRTGKPITQMTNDPAAEEPGSAEHTHGFASMGFWGFVRDLGVPSLDGSSSIGTHRCFGVCQDCCNLARANPSTPECLLLGVPIQPGDADLPCVHFQSARERRCN